MHPYTIDWLANHPNAGIRASGRPWPEPTMQDRALNECFETLAEWFDADTVPGPPNFSITRRHRAGAMADTIHVSGLIGLYNHTRILRIADDGAGTRAVEYEAINPEIDRHAATSVRVYAAAEGAFHGDELANHEDWNAPDAEDSVDIVLGAWCGRPDAMLCNPDALTLLTEARAVGQCRLAAPVSLDLAHLWKIEEEGDELCLVTPEGRHGLRFTYNDWDTAAAAYYWRDRVTRRSILEPDNRLTLFR